MSTRLRLVALALVALILTSACTVEEVTFFLDSTEHVADALTHEELGRLRHCESTDNYQAISRSGTYRGAYQFDQTTWDGVAERHFPWLMGIDPINAAPWWQDSMARALWSERGSQPWPICGRAV